MLDVVTSPALSGRLDLMYIVQVSMYVCICVCVCMYVCVSGGRDGCFVVGRHAAVGAGERARNRSAVLESERRGNTSLYPLWAQCRFKMAAVRDRYRDIIVKMSVIVMYMVVGRPVWCPVTAGHVPNVPRNPVHNLCTYLNHTAPTLYLAMVMSNETKTRLELSLAYPNPTSS